VKRFFFIHGSVKEALGGRCPPFGLSSVIHFFFTQLLLLLLPDSPFVTVLKRRATSSL
jgi:hypothetical protein